jgi:hypothetical protein
MNDITVNAERVGLHHKVEVTFSLSRSYDNPFDPAQIDVTAAMVTPSGARVEVPAFPYQDYQVTREGNRETLRPVGDLVWKVRFAPTEIGEHRLRLAARDAEGESASREVAFEAVADDSRGFIRRSARAPRRFEFDGGGPYFALGENVCWPRVESALRDYELWFGRLRAAGCNFARLWLAGPWIAIAPIHCPDHPEEVGPGRYSQRSSWRLDRVLETAEGDGIYLMLCIDSFNSLRAQDPYPAFEQYPLNARLGGPLKSPGEFFTSPEARKLFQRRLRYYVARWGYSTHVFAWEFWNEVDLVEGYDSSAVAAWHRDMARYLRALDPWRHLITTSFARSDADAAVDGLPEMDFVQTHSYGAPDIAGALLSWSRDKAARYDKPHFVGEFGADSTGKADLEDKTGIHLHNGLWASALSGDAGAAMTWWWDQYVEPENLYHHFAALARFLDGVDWIAGGYRPADVKGIELASGAAPVPSDLLVSPRVESWEKHPANAPRDYTVGRDGAITDADKLSRVLHGLVNHPDQHNPPTFVVDYPAGGAFEVIVGGVSGYGGANLRIRLDGATRLEAEFPDDAPDDTATMRQYDRAYRIPVPAGPHRITAENEGADWLYVAYRFAGYLTTPNVRVVGLAGADSALLWVQNQAHTWWNVRQGGAVNPQGPVCVTLGGVADGRYGIEWWDTYRGEPASRNEAVARGGRLTVTTPKVSRDIACKITRRGGGG